MLPSFTASRQAASRMNDPLATYLQDHLAGAVFGIELVEALEHDHGSDELGRAAGAWRIEIEADQSALRQIVEHIGAAPGTVKDVISWITEKATRLKLRRQSHSDLGTFETLETLALGIFGKEKLWRVLQACAATDPRLAGFDFASLTARAQKQHEAVESVRLQWAARLFPYAERRAS